MGNTIMQSLTFITFMVSEKIPMLTSQPLMTKNMVIISLEYTPVRKMYDIFHIYSNHNMFKVQRTEIQNMQFTVYIFDRPVTLKQSHSHQTQ